jgi:hypothetical protein
MARTADKPGTFRVSQKRDGSFLLSGLRTDGSRVKLRVASKAEGENIGKNLFPAKMEASVDWDRVDDFGIPVRVNDAGIAAANAKLGVPTPLPTPTQPTASPVASGTAVAKVDPKQVESDAEAKARKQKQAKSLMEMIGIAGAAGDVMLAVKLTKFAGKEPVKPNPRQVNDLADSMKDTLTEWFGDRDIRPWQMTILLALGIPLAMLIQSPAKPKPSEGQESQKQSGAK